MRQWIDWIRQIKAISQIGKTYTQDPHDMGRYEQLGEIAHEMLARVAEAPLGRIENFYLPEEGYATPKVDLRAGVFDGNSILLVREREDGCWTLPGGWADVCETPIQGIIREVREESGFIVDNPRLIAIKDRDRHPYLPRRPDHIYKLFFLCELVGGSAAESIETSEVGFFRLSDLPELSIGRTLPDDIARLWLHHSGERNTVYVD